MSSQLPNLPAPALRVVEKGTRSHFASVLACSLALHGLLYFGLHGSERAPVTARAETVRVTVQTLPPKPAEPPVQAASEPAQAEPVLPREAPVLAHKAKPRKEQSKEPPPVVSKPLEAQPEPASEPVDFTGVTLTSTSGAGGWASVTGNGQASTGPLSAPPRGTRAGSGHGTSDRGEGKGEGVPVVGLGSLSRPPRAPRLDEALLHNYPKPAREQGQPGHAVVRARIMPDGRVDKMQVLVASAPEFGRACQRTLSGSRWSPPLDGHGKPVATDVSYTCQFEVTR